MADGGFAITDGMLTNKHFATAAEIAVTKLAARSQVRLAIPLEQLRVWNALATNLPGTPASDDLGLVTGTWGTDAPYAGTGDLKAAGATTRYAAFLAVLPPDYEAGEPVTLRVKCGMKTTVSDTTCTLDAEMYAFDKASGTIDTTDLVSTGATTMNSLTAADVDFALDEAALEPGQMVEVRLAIACNDGATVTAVIGAIWQVELLCDTR